MTGEAQFAVECPNGTVWEDACTGLATMPATIKVWDLRCDCGGPHRVVSRAVGPWKPVVAPPTTPASSSPLAGQQ